MGIEQLLLFKSLKFFLLITKFIKSKIILSLTFFKGYCLCCTNYTFAIYIKIVNYLYDTIYNYFLFSFIVSTRDLYINDMRVCTCVSACTCICIRLCMCPYTQTLVVIPTNWVDQPTFVELGSDKVFQANKCCNYGTLQAKLQPKFSLWINMKHLAMLLPPHLYYC